MLALACLVAVANERSVAETKPASMRFEWRTEGPAERCGQNCRTWISAGGVITEASAREFDQVDKNNDPRGPPLGLVSEAGSVLSALAIVRAVRRLDMTTTVGRTQMLPAAGGAAPRATLAPKASCESMCAFILLGGARRYVPPEARVLVHQIW